MILRNKIAILIILGFYCFKPQAQLINDSITMETNYTNQVFYSLDNGEIATIDNNDWDLAFAGFERGAAGSAILINEANVTLWSHPGDTSSWSTFDTTGYLNWEQLLNSDTSWTNGAFNKYRGKKGLFDMGWGELNPQNNFWTFGNSLYLAKLQDESYKKIWIISLKSGVWEFKYANLDGSNEQTIIIDKSDYSQRNFIYHSMITDLTLDREPDNTLWDFMFSKHTDEVLPDLYLPVTSVFNNRNIWSAKANKPDYRTAINSTSPETKFNQKINNIGREWKRFKSATGWTVYDSIAYFIYDNDSTNFYRLVFTKFGGRANGNVLFTKELLQNVAVKSYQSNIVVSTYPNPTIDNIILLIDFPINDNIEILLLNMSGTIIYNRKEQISQGVNQYNIDINHIKRGMYILQIGNNKFSANQKITIQ